MDTEQWRPIPGYEGEYSVSAAGNVRGEIKRRRWQAGRILQPQPNGTGYLKVMLRGDVKYSQLLVHRLVLLAFVGPCPDGCECNHKNGDKHDNRLENLEYCTPKENQAHRYEVLGHSKNEAPAPLFGEAHPHSRITADIVREVRRLHAAGGLSQREIGERFGIKQTHVGKIVRRVLWPHID